MCHVLDRVKVELLLAKSQVVINKRTLKCLENLKKNMWWRVITFCVLVSIVIFVVFSCIHGRPVLKMFFHTCNDNHEMEHFDFKNNFLRERLVSNNFTEPDSSAQIAEELEEILDKVSNVHSLESRVKALEEYTLAEKIKNGDVKQIDDGQIIYNFQNRFIVGLDFVEDNDNETETDKILEHDNSHQFTEIEIQPNRNEQPKNFDTTTKISKINNSSFNIESQNKSMTILRKEKNESTKNKTGQSMFLNVIEATKLRNHTTTATVSSTDENKLASDQLQLSEKLHKILSIGINTVQNDDTIFTSSKPFTKNDTGNSFSETIILNSGEVLFEDERKKNDDIIVVNFTSGSYDEHKATDQLGNISDNITEDSSNNNFSVTSYTHLDTTTKSYIDKSVYDTKTAAAHTQELDGSPFQNILRKVLHDINSDALGDDVMPTVNTREAIQLDLPLKHNLRLILNDMEEIESTTKTILEKYSWLKQP